MRRFGEDRRIEAMRFVGLVFMAFVAVLSLAVPAMPARAATNYVIDMYDYYYAPQFLTVSVGDTVQWSNLGTVQHTATSNDTAAWGEVVVNPDTTSPPLTLTVSGVFPYIDSVDYAFYGMWGQITVVGTAVPEFSSFAVVAAGMLVLALGLSFVRRTRR